MISKTCLLRSRRNFQRTRQFYKRERIIMEKFTVDGKAQTNVYNILFILPEFSNRKYKRHKGWAGPRIMRNIQTFYLVTKSISHLWSTLRATVWARAVIKLFKARRSFRKLLRPFMNYFFLSQYARIMTHSENLCR